MTGHDSVQNVSIIFILIKTAKSYNNPKYNGKSCF